MDIFKKVVLIRRVSIPMHAMGNVQDELTKVLENMEGRCIEEGYLRNGSTKVVSHSCGLIKGGLVILNVTFEGEIANPEMNQLLLCIVTDNSRAGIKARIQSNESPYLIFIPRNATLPDLVENDKIRVMVIAQRYEINDPKVSIIASLCEKVKEPVKVDIEIEIEIAAEVSCPAAFVAAAGELRRTVGCSANTEFAGISCAV
jgi:DNA-directed RNA polymerase subunit E'/Rpb7